MKQFTLKSLMLLLLLLIGGGSYAWGETKTYQHVFNAKPKEEKGVTLSEMKWDIVATNLNGYNSQNYAGVQIGTSKKDGSVTLTSSADWNYKNATKITAVRLWLNLGGTSVTPSVTIGGKNAVSDGTKVVKNSKAGNDWTKATKVTFTPAEDGNTGVVVINVSSVKAGYICAMEIDCEDGAPAANLTSIAVSGTPTKITYFEGEVFDPTGLVVTATYEDESTEVVTSRVEWTFNPETLTLGTNEVKATATYGEMTASKTVTVTVTEAPKVVGIDLTKDNTTTANENKLEWLGEIVTVTANKAANGTNANNYYPGTTGKEYTSTRFYKNSTLTFTPAPFVVLGEITYVATASKDETAIKYANVMENSTWTNATAKANGKIVTITPIDGTKPVSAKISDTTGGKSFSINYSLANETSLTLVAKSNDIYYATFSSASACEFAGADVFTVNVEGENIVLNEVASKQVPANTGVLVKSTANAVTVTRLETAPAIEGTNLLRPACEKMTEGFKYYKLAYDNYTEKTGLGFYWGAAEGGAFTVKPGLAYLAVPQAQAANVKGFSFDGTQTSINGVEATTAKGAIYNLNGQRVEKAQCGIYIQNGKKFIVK